MKMTIREKDEVKILDFEGYLDSNTSPDAEAKLNEIITGGAQKILFNFKNLKYISSAGVRILLSTVKTLQKNKGELRICHLNEKIDRIFRISGINQIFNVFVTETEALTGF